METNEIRQIKIEKLQKLQGEGIAGYSGRFDFTHPIAQILEPFEDEKKVALA